MACGPGLRFAAFGVLSVAAGSALANDGFGQLGVGGIAIGKTDSIAMAKEVLDISYRDIHVAYDFLNVSAADVTTTVSFPLPAYAAFPAQSGVISKGRPAGFSVTVNGQARGFETRVQAVHDGRDITPLLHSLGLSDADIANMPFAIDAQGGDLLDGVISDVQLAALRQAGLLFDSDLPDWTIQVVYQWQQTFPAHASTHVEHDYQPFVAMGTASGYQGAAADNVQMISAFCMDSQSQSVLDHRAAEPARLDPLGELPGTIVDYILMTANSWKDGIRDFTLRLHKQHPQELISLCFPGNFSKLDALTLESRMTDFKPQTDLHIYFGNLKMQPEQSYGVPPL